jgi:hypothetical protein
MGFGYSGDEKPQPHGQPNEREEQMNVTRCGHDSNTEFQFNGCLSVDGPSWIRGTARLTVHRLGVVKVLTPGENHFIVDHVPFYIDCTVTVYGDGTVAITREHIVYRFGRSDGLSDLINEATLTQLRLLVCAAVQEARRVFPAEIGVFAVNDEDANDRAERAQLKRTTTLLEHQLRLDRARVTDTQRRIDEALERLGAIDGALSELNERIKARAGNPTF